MHYWEAEGLTTVEACGVLKTLASDVPAAQCIVEIGVFRGRSLLALAEGSAAGNSVPVYGVDPWNLDRPSKEKYKSDDTYEYACQAVNDNPAGDLILLIKGFGVAEAARFDTSVAGKVGLLYIDGDHRRGPVLQDFAAWAPHMADDAVICFDDHDMATFPGVVQAVTELLADGKLADFFMATDRLAVARFVRA